MSRLLAGATSTDNGHSSGPIFSAARTLIRISTPAPTGDIASREPQLMELRAAGSSDDRGILGFRGVAASLAGNTAFQGVVWNLA